MDTANLIADLKDAEGYITAAAFLADHAAPTSTEGKAGHLAGLGWHLYQGAA